MIRRVLVLFLCVLGSAFAAPAPKIAGMPTSLLTQIQGLTDLMRDSYAIWNPDATLVQFVKPENLALVVFTVEGYGGRNNNTQYLSVFSQKDDDKGTPYFTLIDVMAFAGYGWRSVNNLNARVTRIGTTMDYAIALDALEVTGSDEPNAPSRKTTIRLMLKGGRLVDTQSP